MIQEWLRKNSQEKRKKRNRAIRSSASISRIRKIQYGKQAYWHIMIITSLQSLGFSMRRKKAYCNSSHDRLKK